MRSATKRLSALCRTFDVPFGIAFISGSGGSSRASISRTLTSDLSLNDTRRPFFLAEGLRPAAVARPGVDVDASRRVGEAEAHQPLVVQQRMGRDAFDHRYE